MSSENGKAVPVINISAYKFITLVELPQLQNQLQAACLNLGLLGTILLSVEGMNLNLAGTAEGIDAFCQQLLQDSRFCDLIFKRSESDFVPFKRLLVKIKPEIITFKDPTIQPQHETVRHLPPTTLAQWLNEGKDVLLVDTRNAFEVEYGTFKNAKQVNIHQFSDLATKAQDAFTPEDKHRPVVLFCTGGVRCEKAGPAFTAMGFTDVYQLDGGILAYFEQCGGQHYEGDCFVFDERVALDPHLQPLVGGMATKDAAA